MRSFDPCVIPEAVRPLSGWLCVPGPSLWAGGDQHHLWYWTRAMPGKPSCVHLDRLCSWHVPARHRIGMHGLPTPVSVTYKVIGGVSFTETSAPTD